MTLKLLLGSNPFDEVDDEIQRLILKVEAGFQCSECGHFSKQKPNMVNHIEAKHVKHAGILCELCHKRLVGIYMFRFCS